MTPSLLAVKGTQTLLPSWFSQGISRESPKRKSNTTTDLRLGGIFGLRKPVVSSLSAKRLKSRTNLATLSLGEVSSNSTCATPAALQLYTKGEHLGSGCQGSVYRARSKGDGENYVMKVLSINEEERGKMARQEIKVLNKIKGQEHVAKIV